MVYKINRAADDAAGLSISEKMISPAELITHRLTLVELEKGFHIMRDKTDDYVKVMMCDIGCNTEEGNS